MTSLKNMENINSIGIIIYTNVTIEEITNSNYINSKNTMVSEAWSLDATEIWIDTKNYLLVSKLHKIKLIIRLRTIE